MSDLARLQPVLWVVTAVLLVAGLVTIPLVDDDAKTAQGTGQWVGTVGPTDVVVGATTTVAPPEAVAGEAPAADAAPAGTAAVPGTAAPSSAGRSAAAPSTTVPAETPAAATAASPPEELGAPQDPGPPVPPRAGRYLYKATTNGESRETSTSITDRGTAGGETRQLVSMRGSGIDVDSEVAWRKDGVHVLSSEFQFGQNRGQCDWQPDMLQLKLPLSVGTTWESTGTCNATGFGPTPVPIKRTITGRVVELRRIRIAGQVVDVWAIDGTEHIEFAGNVIDAAGTTLFSPKHGLAVSSKGTGSGSGPGGSGSGEATTEIQNLDPLPL